MKTHLSAATSWAFPSSGTPFGVLGSSGTGRGHHLLGRRHLLLLPLWSSIMMTQPVPSSSSRPHCCCLPIPSFNHIYGLLCARHSSGSSGYISGYKGTKVPALTELPSELTACLVIPACLRLLSFQAFCLLPSSWQILDSVPNANTVPQTENVVS